MKCSSPVICATNNKKNCFGRELIILKPKKKDALVANSSFALHFAMKDVKQSVSCSFSSLLFC